MSGKISYSQIIATQQEEIAALTSSVKELLAQNAMLIAAMQATTATPVAQVEQVTKLPARKPARKPAREVLAADMPSKLRHSLGKCASTGKLVTTADGTQWGYYYDGDYTWVFSYNPKGKNGKPDNAAVVKAELGGKWSSARWGFSCRTRHSDSKIMAAIQMS